MKLIRSDPEYRHFPVDAVCGKHQEENALNCPMEPLPTEIEGWRFTQQESGVLMYNCGSALDLGPGGTLNVSPSLIFPCNASCGKQTDKIRIIHFIIDIFFSQLNTCKEV